MVATGHDRGRGGDGRRTLVVLLLAGALVVLHRFAAAGELDATGVLALGFVILASYALGELADGARLPRITGYLLAGVLFGPSVAALLPEQALAPFDRGVLDDDVIAQLGVLDTLAVALIAASAGGAVQIEALRRGLASIGAVLTGQLVTILALLTTFVWAVSGPFPDIAMPGLGEVPAGAVLGLGATVAAIGLATSPAATIAVITDAGAEGPTTRTILSTVVLKDVLVVILFAAGSTWAAVSLGVSAVDQPVGSFLARHLGGSLGIGVGVGAALALYLRWAGREVLLVVLGAVYATTLLARDLWLDPMLVFMAAGFTVGNFSRAGGPLVRDLQRLSMPVHLVFFTLLGAKLDLAAVAHAAPFAAALVGLRMVALWLGVSAGARIAGDRGSLRRHGWMGFVSQAGVSLPLAALVGSRLGEVGEALQTLLVAGVVINEVVGPAMLRVALGRSRETPQRREGTEAKATSVPPARVEKLPAWPEAALVEDAWGGPTSFGSETLNREVRELTADLQALIRDVQRGPLERFRGDATAYLRDLRREFLRHHRRLIVATRDLGEGRGVGAVLHREESELADRWRGTVLGRAARVAQRTWSPDQLVDSIDRVVSALPEVVQAPYEPETFLRPEAQSPLVAVRRSALRIRRWFRAVTGREMVLRRVELQQLARYHLGGRAPRKLEALAALLVQAETHLASRTRSLFDAIAHAYDAVAAREEASPAFLEADLRDLRLEVESELALAQEEVERIVREGTARMERILGDTLKQVKEELGLLGTVDLPNGRRRSSRVFRERVGALALLGDRLDRIRVSVSGTFALVALELELVALEARVKDALAEHSSSLEKDVRGRTHLQAERVVAAIAEAQRGLEEELRRPERPADALIVRLRELTEPVDRVAGEASRAVIQLRDQLMDERVVTPLLDALGRACRGLTDRYEIPTATLAHGEWRLPRPVPVVEVPYRELVSSYVDAQVAPELLSITRATANQVQPLAASLVELERLVAFNVELASGELDVLHEEPVPEETRTVLREVLLGGLERNLEVMRGHAEEASRWPHVLGAETRGAVLGGLERLRGRLVEGDVAGLHAELPQGRAPGRRPRRPAGGVGPAFRRTRGWLARRVARRLGEERLEAWRQGLGLPDRREEEAPGPRAFAPPRAGDRLPLVYRRLFAAETIEAGDVLTGRDLQIDRARRVLAGEEAGALRAVALVGQDGVGKGALSGAIVRSRSWKNVRRIVLEQPATLEQVEGWLRDRPEGNLYVISGFHWLVAMRPGGFVPLRRFVQGVIEDAGRNAWMLHADHLVWEYATQVAPLGDAFPEVIELPVLDPRELEAAMLARHGLSGYGLSFDPRGHAAPPEDGAHRDRPRMGRPYEGYFRDLHQASGGLVRDALRLWIASIDEVSEAQDFVHVGPVPPSPQRVIRRLPEEILLALYQIARQGWMNAEVHAHLFRVDAATAEAQLSRLLHLGLVDRYPAGTYRIQTHLRGPVFRVLQEQGWLR